MSSMFAALGGLPARSADSVLMSLSESESVMTLQSTHIMKKTRKGVPVVNLSSLARVSGWTFLKQSILTSKGSGGFFCTVVRS